MENQVSENQQDKLLEDAFEGLHTDIIGTVKQQLFTCLNDPKHAKHEVAKDIITYAEKKRAQEDTSADTTGILVNNTTEALNAMHTGGVSLNTISTIYESVYDSTLRYNNIAQKVENFDYIETGDAGAVIHRDMNKQLDAGIGGTCAELALRLKYMLEEKISDNTIEFKIVGGQSRDVFSGTNSGHIYLEMIIGDTSFVLDPSFGEISLYDSSGYNRRNTFTDNEIEITNQEMLSYGKLINDDVYIQGSSILPLGIFSKQKIACGLGFVKKEQKTIPVVQWFIKEGYYGYYWIENGILKNHMKIDDDSVEQEIEKILGIVQTKLPSSHLHSF